jgi:hypothetical protein
MEKVLFKDKYPVWKVEVEKEKFGKSLEDIVDYFLKKIEEDPIAKLIGVFDHYSHTQSIGGPIAEGLEGAKMVVFCFGKEIPGALALATKPRSIGIAETNDKFVISFLEAPSDGPNEKMRKWISELIS